MPQNQQEKDVQAKRTRENVLGVVINVVLIIAIIIAFLCTYTAYVTKNGSGVPDILGYEPFSIQSDSMKPFFEKGDLVIDKRVEDTSKLKVGDVITFWTIIDGQKVLNTHRITSIEEGDNFRYFVTKGDNNSAEDSLTVHESEIVGIYHKHIKNLGGVLDFLQTSKGFFCIIVLPVFAFFLYYLVSFFRVLFEYQSEKKRILYEQELIATGRLNAPTGEAGGPAGTQAVNVGTEADPVRNAGKSAVVTSSDMEDEKPMQEVMNRFLEKHQGKKNAKGSEADSAAQKELLRQMEEMKKQMELLQQQNMNQQKNQEAGQTGAAQQANAASQAGAAVQPQTNPAQQPVNATRQSAPQANAAAAQVSGETITLSKEQLLALLGQANLSQGAGQASGAGQMAGQQIPNQPVQSQQILNQPVQNQPVQSQPVSNQSAQSQPVQSQSAQQGTTKNDTDSISMSKSEFVDLISLAMKKAKDEE